MYRCQRCDFGTRTYMLLVQHYKYVHSAEHDFRITCGVKNCFRTYISVRTLMRHIRSKHKMFHEKHLSKWRNKQAGRHSDENSGNFDDNEWEDDMDENGIDLDQEGYGENGQGSFDWTRFIGLKLLKLREKSKVSSSVITEVSQILLDLLELQQNHLCKKLTQVLQENGVDIDNIHGLTDILNGTSDAAAACMTINSSQKLNKYAKTNFFHVEPQEYLMAPDTYGNRFTCQYIPILETIKGLLKQKTVRTEVLNGHVSTDEILRDICDGSKVNSSPFFSGDEKTLQIILYFDEFTVVNPLGTKVKKNKIAAFYMLLGNIPPIYRSKLDAIQLVLLCRALHVKRSGFSHILEPLVHDLKCLEDEGITVNTEDGEINFKGSIVVVVGDNLGSHGLGGFLENFNGMKFCRFCTATKQAAQSMFDSSTAQMRTENGHNRQVVMIQDDPA